MLLSLDLRGQKVLVVGGGRVATRRAIQFLREGAELTVISPDLTPELKELYQQGKIRWKPRKVRLQDLSRRWFLIALCLSDPSRDRFLLERARKRSLWISSALGRGTVRHIAYRSRNGWTIGVDSGGKDPARARKLAETLVLTLPE